MPSDFRRLDRQARAFAAQFRAFTPAAPALCLNCFYAFYGSLDSAAYDHLSTKCTDFLDALMGFVATDYALNDRDRRMAVSVDMMLYQGRECPKCSTAEVTGLGLSTQEPPFDTFFDFCCRTLATCLAPPMNESRHSKIQKKPFRRGSWPSTPEQLFPRGAEQTVGHLVQLSSVMYSGPIVLLTAMLLRYRKPVFEQILHPRHNYLLLRRVEPALAEAARVAADALAAFHGNASSRPTSASDRVVVKAIARFDDFPRLLHVILSGVDHEGHDLDRFAFRYEARLYRAVVSVVEKLHNPGAWEVNLPNVAISLYSSLEAADRLDPPKFIETAVMKGKKRAEDPYLNVARHLPLTLARRACFGCGKQVHENLNGKAFSKCGRCKAVQYCSKECQRNDWNLKHGQPHKIICDILSEVLTIMPLETMVKSRLGDVARAWRAANFPPERVRRLSQWMLGHDGGHVPTAYAELLNQSIGTTPLPHSLSECKTKDEMLRFIERQSGTRYPPGSRVVLVPVRNSRGRESEEDNPSVIPLWTEEESQAYEEIEPEEGKHYPGPYLVKIIPPGSTTP
ncbi:hypothetical protein EXIGLDRAFT_834735 [Exidia glandulosa HHB12029]|uniref:MYND-type domain-containing protein n=1 Tax=Exidia glandulosa HHB12029 TaxID=1314781 RepID=A0A165JF82_EXIGL|nr:hypothetical protein EXIGLDRAFT_834735 [Exidia glandulosa HHB12029]